MGLFGKSDPKPAAAPAPAAPTATAPPPPPPKPTAKSTVMGEKTRFVGKIDTDEPLLIQGPVEGEIKSSSEVEVGETGVVKANISAKSIVISGRVTGDCTASDRLEIRAAGTLTGSIKAARIAIADGAAFKGTSQMGPAARS
ncbi:MAG: polymer-forming cytoskeletal protein [Vicinamibacteria bacterium]|jgi:cytoskeletal protein CcmA (bactofilin family)|nr:polymer-forming cytoskeletal protein [Vicinamibacteria bacterium]MBP9948454.1 polymer-forming cytoskeletal protein [Vicinamibacteria bacterium]